MEITVPGQGQICVVPYLDCIAHHRPAPHTDPLAVTGRTPGRFDVVTATHSAHSPPFHRWCHFHRYWYAHTAQEPNELKKTDRLKQSGVQDVVMAGIGKAMVQNA